MAGLNRLGLELELETYGTLWKTMENTMAKSKIFGTLWKTW
jgi:hypothetical protein